MGEIKNLFSKGWQNDNEPSLQPPNTVRDILNMRLISSTGNTYSLESLKGTLLSFSLNPNYFPIGWVRFGNDIAIFSTKDITGTDQNGEIGIATINPTTSIGTYVPRYNSVALKFNSAHQIESRSYIENDFIGRVYWTDEYNTFRALNLLDPRFTTYFAVGALVVGVQYMVLTEKVTNGTDDYGPNETGGTVFIADGTEVYTTTPLVIAYVDVSILDTVPTRDQGNITFNSWLPNGNLLGGGYQYTYQLFTSGGIETNFSYVTMPFHVGNTTIPAATTLSYQAYQGTSIITNSQKGHRIQIDNIDTNFDSIRVIAIQDTSLIAANPPVIFFSGPITGSTMTFDHMGNENLGTLSAANLEAVVLAIRRIGTLAILKNRMFIGDIEFAPFVPFDRTGVTATPIEYLMPSDVTGRPADVPNASAAGLAGHGICAANIPPIVGNLYKNLWFRVGGTGSVALQPSGTIVATGGTFQGTVNNRTYTVNAGAPTVTAVIRIQKYTGEYRYIDILDDWVDTKGAAVATHLRSLWRGETYRYGILIYDNFQNPMFVQWLDDVLIPEQYDNAGAWILAEETANYYGAGLHDLSLRNIGLNFSGLDFNLVATALGVTLADLPKYIGGFSIVRAPLDNQILGQGILGPTVIDGNNTRPTSTLNVLNDLYGAANGRRVQTYVFHCPEFEFGFNNLPNTVDGDELNIVDRYDDQYQATSEAGTIETSGFHWYSKLYESTANAAGYGQKGDRNEVVRLATINIGVGQSGIQYDPVNNPTLLFENRSETSAAFAPGANRTCIGSEAYLISTDSNEPGSFPNGYAYSDETRSLVNYIRPKGNLYGGQGESALAATQYMFCGHYQPFDAAFLAYLQGNGGIADDIEVFGGDAFVCVVDFARMIQDFADPNPTSFGVFFPVESRINLSLREGRHLARDRSYEAVGNTNGISFSTPLHVEEFVYNGGYSYQETQFLYPALPVNFIPNDKFLRRVYVSPVKVDGEVVDSFRIYPVNDFIDLEGANGELINLLAKSGGLYALQERSAVNLPVNQQTTIPTTLGQPISIGTGGVLQRYDTIQDFYGNQHKFGVVEFESGWCWFDALRKVVVTMTVTGSTANISTSNGVRTFFDSIKGDILFNDNPIRNNGIAAMYNPRFGEMLFSFRGTTSQTGQMQYSPIGYTVAFDNINQQFTGKFSMLPGIMIEVNNLLFVAHTAAYPAIASLTAYFVDDFVTEGATNYVCVLAYTSALVPVDASADPTHWTKTESINEVHVADMGQVCKFFGHVDDLMLMPVCNSDEGSNDVIFDNFQAQSDQAWFDTAEFENSYQKGTDTDLVNDDNYAYLNRSWFFSSPFDFLTGDRLRDHFMTLKLTRDNRLGGNPTVSKNERVKVVSMRYVFRKSL